MAMGESTNTLTDIDQVKHSADLQNTRWYKKNKGAFDKYKPAKKLTSFQRACIRTLGWRNRVLI